MKKQIDIGILTYHYAHNYGAVLQSFALKEYLLKKVRHVTIINYKNPFVEQGYSKNLFKPYLRRSLLSMESKMSIIKGMIKLLWVQPSWSTQHKKFEQFISSVLLDGDDKAVSPDEIGELKVDLFIAGSDQIWNKNLTNGYDDIYFLNFNTSTEKAFYAVSDGNNLVTTDNLPYYSLVLKSIDNISTRESSLADDINKKLSKHACGVVDPVFLLSKDDYVSIFKLRKQKKILFAYFIVEDDFLSQVAEVIARALNLEIIELHYYKHRRMKKNQRADMGPIDFLNCIYNSDFIVTNSFHGTAFSIIFNKQFYSVYQNDARKDNLLEQFGLQSRHIKNCFDIDLRRSIDYSLIDLNTYNQDSRRYLERVIMATAGDGDKDVFGY